MPLPSEDPIVVAPSPTPFRADDTVDYGAIERNVGRWLSTPLLGFVLNSENGEEAFLSEHEKLEIVRTVHRAAGARKLIIGGVDNPSVTETLRLAEALVSVGVEMIRVRIPRLTANVRGYFQQVVPRVSVPVVIIHQPAPGTFLGGAATLSVPAELVGELVAMENVFAYIGSADIRFESRVRTFVPQSKRFWSANGSVLLPGAAIGANGACMMLGNVAPQQCVDAVRLAMAGKWPDAQVLQSRLLDADWQILSRGAAGLKAALRLLGYETGVPRSPQPPCTAAETEQIQKAMRQAGLIT
jgi:dihydrodipicolinate synthase/N-acetylneuraminate lyase